MGIRKSFASSVGAAVALIVMGSPAVANTFMESSTTNYYFAPVSQPEFLFLDLGFGVGFGSPYLNVLSPIPLDGDFKIDSEYLARYVISDLEGNVLREDTDRQVGSSGPPGAYIFQPRIGDGTVFSMGNGLFSIPVSGTMSGIVIEKSVTINYFCTNIDCGVAPDPLFFLRVLGPAPSLAEAVNPSVPEPSTWAMLLIGFAGIGLVLYRKRDTLTLV